MNTLTEAKTALTADPPGHSWTVSMERQTLDEYPDLPGGGDLEYLSVSFPERTGHVVEIFVSTCTCDDDDGLTERHDTTPLEAGPPGRGYMVVWLDAAGVDQVAEDHVTPDELRQYAQYWLIDYPDADVSEVRP